MLHPRKRSRGSKRQIQLFFRRLGDFFSPFADGFRRASAGVKAAILGGTVGTVAIVVFCLAFFGDNTPQPTAISRAMAMPDTGSTDGLVTIELTPSPSPAPTPSPTPEPILHRGVESDKVPALQQRLMELGYMEVDEPTNLFGPATEAAVRLFQRQVNFTEELGIQLDQDGWAGEQTLSLLYSDDAPKYVVKEGMEGSDIENMQLQLKDMGYMSAITGYYGEKTVAAIREFQDRNGLAPDGLAGVHTYELLFSPDARESASKEQEARTKANIAEMIEVAESKLGCSYVLGDTGPDTFDCSGLVYYCLKEAGSNRRRLTAAGYSQVDDWEKIEDMDDLKKGDLVFFYNNAFSKVGHVGIVISSSRMIDASSSNGEVVKRSFDTSYWREHFVCGRRPW